MSTPITRWEGTTPSAQRGSQSDKGCAVLFLIRLGVFVILAHTRASPDSARAVIGQSNCRSAALCHVKNYGTAGNFKSLSNIPYGRRLATTQLITSLFFYAQFPKLSAFPAFLLAPIGMCCRLQISIIRFLIAIDEFFTCFPLRGLCRSRSRSIWKAIQRNCVRSRVFLIVLPTRMFWC